MNKKALIISLLLLLASSILLAHEMIDIEMGLSSYIGGYYYQNNDKKDFEYKDNHNWYLNLNQKINRNITSSANIRYYPELFDKKLYLYSAQVSYHSDSLSLFEFSWEYSRIGLGQTNHIFKNRINDNRSDQNFITDYRFNGAVVKHRLIDKLFIEYRVGGNDYNTGLGGIELSLKQPRLNFKQSILMVSRDNRFNAKAININNLLSWESNNFFIQNMFHNSYIDYYRQDAQDKSSVVKDLLETRFTLTSFIEPEFSFYYEAENWHKYRIYESNSIMNLIFNRYEISPAYKLASYRESIQREYSLLVNYQIHSNWTVGLFTKFIDQKNNQDIISYGLQTKFNFPNNHTFDPLFH